jgi:AcrR family transcriptional regulator
MKTTTEVQRAPAAADGPAAMADRIRTSATALFYEQGYHGTTMRELAADVGITAGSLYNHFATKQDLLFDICMGTMRELLEGARAALAAHDDVEARLRALLEWHVTYHVEHRLEAIVGDTQINALTPENRAPVVGVRDEHERLFVDCIEAGVATGRWHVGDVKLIAMGMATMCTGVGTWYREGGRLGAPEIARTYADYLLAGLAGGVEARS